MNTVNCNLVGFVPFRAGGAHVFLRGVLRELARFSDIRLKIFGSNETVHWVEEFIGCKEIEYNVVCKNGSSIVNRTLGHRCLKRSVTAGELVWSPLNQGIRFPQDVKTVLTIHDLIPLHYFKNPEGYASNRLRGLYFGLKWWNSYSTI